LALIPEELYVYRKYVAVKWCDPDGVGCFC
jgi:hypothetical protein